MEQATVTLEDGYDHLVGEDANSLCGQPVTMGDPIVETTTKPCPECFPDTAKPKKAKKDAAA